MNSQLQKDSDSSSTENIDISGIENFFGMIGAVIRSLTFVLIGILFFMGYRFFEVQSLFRLNFPTHIEGISKEIASVLIGLVFIIPTLLFMSNNDKLKNLFAWKDKFKGVGVPVVMAWITLLINGFFWKVWIGTSDIIIFKVVISIITAYFDYTFSELFNKKFQDWQKTNSFYQSIYKLEQHTNSLKQTINEYKQRVNKLTTTRDEIFQSIKAAKRELDHKKKGLEKYACPYCLDYVGETHQGLNKHSGSCEARKKELNAA